MTLEFALAVERAPTLLTAKRSEVDVGLQVALQCVPVDVGGVTDVTDSPRSPAPHALVVLVGVSEAEFSVGVKLLPVGRGSLSRRSDRRSI